MSTTPLINRTSSWELAQIESYLRDTAIPMRLACQDSSGFPLVCSLWFMYRDGVLWCASHRNSRIVALLERDNRCAFEIGVNEPPYQGVRGQGTATLESSTAGQVLTDLIGRYRIAPDSTLARFLTSRVDDEYAIRIEINRMTAWDYTRRMRDATER